MVRKEDKYKEDGDERSSTIAARPQSAIAHDDRQRQQQQIHQQEQQQQRQQHRRRTQKEEQDDVPLLPAEYYEDLRVQASSMERVGNLDVLSFDEEQTLPNGSTLPKTIGLCHLVHMVPLTLVDAETQMRGQLLERQSPEEVAAMFLAVQHLNHGIGSVVEEVEGLNERCNIRFTTEWFDTQLSELEAVNALLDVVGRDPAAAADDGTPLPCAFLGASRSAVSMPTAIITGIKGYPQFSARSTSTALNNKSQYKLFGRTVPSDGGTATPAVRFLRDQLHVRHFVILHSDDAYGTEYARSLQKTVALIAPEMKLVTVDIPAIEATDEDFAVAVSIIKSTQFRYVYAIVFGEQTYNPLMQKAYENGVAGPGFTWIFADATSPTTITGQTMEKNSPIAMASQGISILKAQGSIPGMPGYDRFVKAWQAIQNNPDDVTYLNQRVPSYPDDETYAHLPMDYFLQTTTIPSAPVAFMYDATIALGLAACNVSMSSAAEDGVSWEGGGTAHFNAVMTATPFEGASGQIIFDPTTGQRDPNSALFQLTNIFVNETDGSGNDDSIITFNAVPSHRFLDGKWETIAPYVFSDGSTTPHSDLPDITIDMMHIGTPLRSAGLLLSIIAMSMSVGFSLWTYLNRGGKVVKVSQPTFLHIICAGNFLMALAIVPLSFDDEVASEDVCSVACMAAYWLFWLGFSIAFSAMFSKTWRLNKLFYNPSARRITVKFYEVIVPMLALLFLNIVCLTTWSIVSPMKWVRRTTLTDVFGRTVQSQGYCTGRHSILFELLLIFINGIVLIIALYQVYRARHISNEFGETKYITAAMAGMILVSFIGAPTMVLASENPKANFFVLTCIIFVISTLYLLFIFVPKIQFHKEVVRGRKSMRQVVRCFTRQSVEVVNRNSTAGSGPFEEMSERGQREHRFTMASSGMNCRGSSGDLTFTPLGNREAPARPIQDSSGSFMVPVQQQQQQQQQKWFVAVDENKTRENNVAKASKTKEWFHEVVHLSDSHSSSNSNSDSSGRDVESTGEPHGSKNSMSDSSKCSERGLEESSDHVDADHVDNADQNNQQCTTTAAAQATPTTICSTVQTDTTNPKDDNDAVSEKPKQRVRAPTRKVSFDDEIVISAQGKEQQQEQNDNKNNALEFNCILQQQQQQHSNNHLGNAAQVFKTSPQYDQAKSQTPRESLLPMETIV